MTLNINRQLVNLSTPKIMGILNITPDSFYDGGKTLYLDKAISKAGQMLKEGASIIDIGGYSSRPGALDISIKEEEYRVLPVIAALVKEFPDIVISIDTFRASVAQKAILKGASMVNDISAGLLDKNMLEVAGELGVPLCMMHMRGTPQTMKQHTDYDNITKEVLHYFSERIAAARKAKVNDVIIDPGFGFAKTIEQNYELLNSLDKLQFLDVPIIAGISRKSMIYKTLNTNPKEALNGTTALHMIALQSGVKILRVHDVKPAAECIQLWGALSRKTPQE